MEQDANTMYRAAAALLFLAGLCPRVFTDRTKAAREPGEKELLSASSDHCVPSSDGLCSSGPLMSRCGALTASGQLITPS